MRHIYCSVMFITYNFNAFIAELIAYDAICAKEIIVLLCKMHWLVHVDEMSQIWNVFTLDGLSKGKKM